MSTDVTLRVARPTDRLDEVVRFYSVGLGLKASKIPNVEGPKGMANHAMVAGSPERWPGRLEGGSSQPAI